MWVANHGLLNWIRFLVEDCEVDYLEKKSKNNTKNAEDCARGNYLFHMEQKQSGKASCDKYYLENCFSSWKYLNQLSTFNASYQVVVKETLLIPKEIIGLVLEYSPRYSFFKNENAQKEGTFTCWIKNLFSFRST
jgi:hypothetical protein